MTRSRTGSNGNLLEAPDQLSVLGYNARKRWFRVIVWTGVLAALCVVSVLSYGSLQGGESLRLAREKRLLLNSQLQRDFVADQASYRDWLDRRGTEFEVRIFDSVSESLFKSLRRQSSNGDGSVMTFLKRTYTSALFGLLRSTFVIVACWRLWLIAAIIGAFLGFRRLRVHDGADFLGILGNGRIFYSGIKARIAARGPGGVPDQHVIGLACPQMVEAHVAKGSELVQIMQREGVLNETNLTLARIVLAHGTYPAFVADHGEHLFLENQFAGQSLLEHSIVTLRIALSLHRQYQAETISDAEIAYDFPECLEVSPRYKLTADDYSGLLERAMNRVLTPRMRHDLARITKTDLVTALLAYQAGKSLAFVKEGGAWTRKSNFSQLTARAVLHSIPSYAHEYDYKSRSDIRRALIFGARRSVYGPVRFVTDLSGESYALRQWVELLMACPHEFRSAAEDVELFGIIMHSNESWTRALLEALNRGNGEFAASLYAVQGGGFFMPLNRVVAIMRRLMGPGQIKRLEELVLYVGQRQRVESLSRELGSPEQHDRAGIPSYERLFAPLTADQIRELSVDHDLDPEDVREWSTLRVVLNSYGWLTRRIGDHTVPEASLVHLAIRGKQPLPGQNERGLVGVSGMVPFRGTRILEQWGKDWYLKFKALETVTMAETKDNLTKRLNGIAPTAVPEGDTQIDSTVAQSG